MALYRQIEVQDSTDPMNPAWSVHYWQIRPDGTFDPLPAFPHLPSDEFTGHFTKMNTLIFQNDILECSIEGKDGKRLVEVMQDVKGNWIARDMHSKQEYSFGSVISPVLRNNIWAVYSNGTEWADRWISNWRPLS